MIDFQSPVKTPGLQVTGGTPGAGKVLTSDASGNASWQDATGGSAFSFGASPPGSPTAGAIWLDSTSGIFYVYVNDGTSSQWVDMSAPGVSVGTTFGGTALLDFGSTPGTNRIDVAVTGQAGIATGAHVHVWLQGSTASNNSEQHLIVPMRLMATSIVADTGFTISAFCDYRLTGTYSVHWTWSN